MVKRRPAREFLFGIYSGLPLILISVMVALNPSGAGPDSPFGSVWTALAAGSLPAVVIAVLTVTALRSKRRFWLIALFGFDLAAVLAAGLLLHRDYFTFVWEAVVLVYILFLWRRDFYLRQQPNRQQRHVGLTVSLTVYGIIMLWELMMGYAISTRQEPRWIESIVYNIYNIIGAQILLAVILSHKPEPQGSPELGPGELRRDGEPLVGKLHLTDTEELVLRAFLSRDNAGNRATCEGIIRTLAEHREPYRVKHRTCTEACPRSNYNPSDCEPFKSLRTNQFASLKGKLKGSGIGRIEPAGSSQKRVKEEGWTLRFTSSSHQARPET